MKISLIISICLLNMIGIANASELERIVYSSRGQLCSVSPSTNKSSCITSIKEFSHPSWQPHGDKIIASIGGHGDTHRIALLKRAGTVIKLIKNSEGFYRPVWSPDGKYFFALKYDLKHSVGRWKADGSQFKKIPVKGFDGKYDFLQMIGFSPSGKKAAILTDDFKKMLIVEVTNNKLLVRKMIPEQFHYVSQAVWQDNDSLLFVGKKNSTQGAIWKINIISNSISKVGVSGLWLRDSIAISPNRKSVVFCATKNEKPTKWRLWKYSLETKEFGQITTGLEDVNPSWR